MRVLAGFLLSIALLFGAAPVALAEGPMTQREIEESLTCQCGCGLTVASCNHLDCGFAVPVRKEIAEALARGEAGEQILAGYKAKYGEKVLSSPVAEGFNVLAWIAPYAAILVAGVLMFAFFRHRAGRGGPGASVVAGSPTAAPVDDERISRLQKEVEDLER